jgi:RNA polymerase sigma factor (sigma-70 family)
MVTADRLSLIDTAQAGDTDALGRLLAACQPDARRYARRHCMPSDVDDAVQEALIIVTRRLRSLRIAEAFSGWLFTVVERECRKLARALGRYEPLAEDDANRWATLPSDDLRVDLVAALESLPAHYREVLLLRDFEEMTISEIATRLNEPAGAVKSRLHRARALVREYLGAPFATA